MDRDLSCKADYKLGKLFSLQIVSRRSISIDSYAPAPITCALSRGQERGCIQYRGRAKGEILDRRCSREISPKPEVKF